MIGRMFGPLGALVAMVALFGVGSAHAQARIDDCEKIQAADAYNQCLAKFGPTSKVHSVEPEKPGDIKANSAEAAAGAGSVKGRHAGRHRGTRHAYRGSSRKHIFFSVRRRHK